MPPAKPEAQQDDAAVFAEPLEDIAARMNDSFTMEERVELLRNLEASIKESEQGYVVESAVVMAKLRRYL